MDALNQSYGVQAHGYHWDVNTLDWLKSEGTSGAPASDVAVTNFPATQPVSGPLTDAQLAARLPLAVSATFDTSTLATSAKQDTLLTELQGKADLTETQPVSLASIPINAAAATSAKQDTAQTALDAIKIDVDKLPSQGQALAAGSLPVVLTAIQQAALTPPAAIAGFALEAGHLAAIDTSTAKIPAQGQALAAGSLPVVLTAIQQTALTPPAAITGFALETTQQLQATAAQQTTAQTSLTTIAALSKAEDSASADGDPGVVALSIRQDLPAITTSATGDYQPPTVDAYGRVWVNGASVTQPVVDPVAQAWQMRALLLAANQPTNGFVPQEIPSFFAGF